MQNQQDSSSKTPKQYLPALPTHRDSAMQIFRTSSDISSPEKLAMIIKDDTIARYKDIPKEERELWIGSQIYGLCLILHYQAPTPQDVMLDSIIVDGMIMENQELCCLKQVEMQEAFRKGIAKEYGDFFGVTATSIVKFLEGYVKCEKRAQAVNILYKEERRKLEEEDRLFWATLAKAKEDGIVDIPEFEAAPFEDDAQHLERIRKQREEILKAYGK